MKKYLRQHSSLQLLLSVLFPGQGFPPLVWPVHDLDLVDVPPPHAVLQLDQAVQDDQIPSTPEESILFTQLLSHD